MSCPKIPAIFCYPPLQIQMLPHMRDLLTYTSTSSAQCGFAFEVCLLSSKICFFAEKYLLK